MNITELEKQVLEFVAKELSDWRYDEPGYSCIDGNDIAKGIKVSGKTVSGVIGSLCKKGFLESYDFINGPGQMNTIIYPNWDLFTEYEF